MIISHEHKFAFFRNPKTGSTTASYLLRTLAPSDVAAAMLGYGFPAKGLPKELQDKAHLTPGEAVELGILTEEQLLEYRVYVFFREPIERFLSAVAFRFGPATNAANVQVSLDEPEIGLHRPQVDYFYYRGQQIPQVRVLDFRKLGSEIMRMLDEIGGVRPYEVPRLNQRRLAPPMEQFLTPDVDRRLREKFARDLEEWERFALSS